MVFRLSLSFVHTNSFSFRSSKMTSIGSTPLTRGPSRHLKIFSCTFGESLALTAFSFIQNNEIFYRLSVHLTSKEKSFTIRYFLRVNFLLSRSGQTSTLHKSLCCPRHENIKKVLKTFLINTKVQDFRFSTKILQQENIFTIRY